MHKCRMQIYIRVEWKGSVQVLEELKTLDCFPLQIENRLELKYCSDTTESRLASTAKYTTIQFRYADEIFKSYS